jgi:hypothetical protein
MNSKAMIGWTLACVLGVAAGSISPADAQSTIGGAKTQQNKIGGAAKPPPVIGGAIKPITAPSPPKPAPIIGMAKPNSPAGPTPGSTGSAPQPIQTSAAAKQIPPVTPPKKSKILAASNLKCGSGACTSRGAKP